ncbi:jumonji protein [Punctularia strigosozonata HHB-11173 SS5]|uniref:jumonji protein n=1 Tax=Punctularia strigosozonata (strain HHB-11173) TaxID=741275 RepID=UPI0004416E58|nr:jumonji protein [Punctularia strigosozonata HHB-11173 SS5]EIN07626.1 jumonji protein [Punctularia strigosozonata HHB-11173 SS5]
MVAARRRSSRVNAQAVQASQDSAAEPNDSESQTNGHNEPSAKRSAEEDRCPACEPKDEQGSGAETPAADKESWVRCDACKTWFHWRCVGQGGGDLEAVDKWFCTPCRSKDPSRVITMKPPARKSSRKRAQRDYANMHSGDNVDATRWTKMFEGKKISPDNFRRMQGSEVTMEWLEGDDAALKTPIVIEDPEGLGMKMPDSSFTVSDVASIVGEQTPVEVIDVASQANSPGWTLGKWAEYYNTPPEKRDKIRNVISLEISGTSLADQVLPPRLVRELDWVEKFWPANRKGKGHAYPKVQLYCLMGVKNAWTDWHIDFAGSSVYYHVLRGVKVFYFIKPTPANLAAYERWSGTEIQNHTWLGDMVDEVIKVELHAGNTMIIPTGWIHAVWTPEDALVFGGNFLHSYNMSTQLRVRDIEISTHVPKKFRFPHFVKLCWYAAEKYLRDLKAKEEFSLRVLTSVEALADFLVSEVRTMERGSESAKREAREQVPSDRVKDAPGLARELRWRARLAAGYNSDDEGSGRRRVKQENGIAHKRKREDHGHDDDSRPLFRNFHPKAWDAVSEQDMGTVSRVIKVPKSAQEHAETWMDCSTGPQETSDGEEVEVRRRVDVMTKYRKVSGGVQRQRIERVWEDWSWREH